MRTSVVTRRQELELADCRWQMANGVAGRGFQSEIDNLKSEIDGSSRAAFVLERSAKCHNHNHNHNQDRGVPD